MDQNITIDSVFEEKYCLCGHLGIDKFTSITDSYIKYKNKLISFVEIVRETLNFEPTPDNCSLEICDPCKVKLQDFYNFKMRSIRSREIFQQSNETLRNEKLQELKDEMSEGTVEYSILDIIRNYVKNYSINYIEIDENSKRLSIFPGKCSEDPELAVTTDKTEESEYLEEFLEESETNFHENIEYEEIIESQEIEFDDTSSLNGSTCSKSSNIKRSRNPEEWACNKRKKLRNSGKSYLNSKGKIVQERKMLESCAESNCRSNCQSRLTENDRLMNFDNFWKLGDIVEQRKFVYNHILSKEPSRRKSVQSNRSVTLQFYLDTLDSQGNQGSVQVCKKMFKNTLAISNQVIQGVVSKYASSGFMDVRGRHTRKPTEAQEIARQHVQKFPFFYVEQNMTKVQLYNLYVNECKNRGIEPIKESNYREIFDKFNTNSFLKAEKVLCDKCHEFYRGNEEEKQSLQKQHNQHLEESKKCRDRALGRIRHKRAMERKRSEKMKLIDGNSSGTTS